MALYNQRNDEFSIEEAFVDDFVAPPPPPQPQERPVSSGLAAKSSLFVPVAAHQPKGGGARVTKNPEKNEDVEEALPSTRTDPFATREGKTLTWTNVNMTLVGKGGKKGELDRHLLQDVWGEVPVNKTTAIMGPSGAGKTVLLNILAGRASTKVRIKISTDVRLNNVAVDPTNIFVRKQIAFVAQDDSLQITATPRESIRFSAKLRLSRDTTDEELDKLTTRMIRELGLVSCADTLVGGPLLKGISGGERKRTSVGVELVVRPALVFLDEPTSGLDSFSAVQLCHVLKNVANAGASVLFTIHQPSSEIFNSFDHLILLNRGQVMYQGSVEGVPAYFADRGRPTPPNYNPADWIMKDGFFPKDDRKLGDAFQPQAGQDELGITITGHAAASQDTTKVLDARPPGTIVQTAMLFKRELQAVRRNTAAIKARFGLTISLSILVGVIFRGVGDSDPQKQINVQSRFGATIMVLFMSMMGTALPSLLAFPDERPVFLREYSTDHYSVVGYFAARFTMEAAITCLQVLVLLLLSFYLIEFQGNFLLFFVTAYTLAMASTALAVLLGCSIGDSKLGVEFLPILMVPQLLFAGFFVAPDLIPVWLRWARYLCTLTYAVRILLVAEFEECAELSPECLPLVQLKGAGAAGLPECKFDAVPCWVLMDVVEADPDETLWNWAVLIGLFLALRLAALYILRKKASKFY